MKKIIFLIKFTLDSFRDTKKIIKYFNLIKWNGFLVIFKIFYIRFFYSIEKIRLKQKILLLNNIEEHSFFENVKFNTNKISKDIDLNGYSEIFKIQAPFIKKLTDQIFKSKNIDIKTDGINKSDILKNEDEIVEDYFYRLKELKISRITGTLNLQNDSFLKEFLLSK